MPVLALDVVANLGQRGAGGGRDHDYSFRLDGNDGKQKGRGFRCRGLGMKSG